jgi:hypothetical protein
LSANGVNIVVELRCCPMARPPETMIFAAAWPTFFATLLPMSSDLPGIGEA